MTEARDLAQARVFPALLDVEPILATCQKYPPQPAKADYAREDLRRGKVSWVNDRILRKRLWRLVQDINREFF